MKPGPSRIPIETRFWEKVDKIENMLGMDSAYPEKDDK